MNKKRGPKVKVYNADLVAIFKCMGTTLRKLRKEKGFTSHETFAFRMGLARAQYLKYELGGNIQMDSFLLLMKEMDIKPSAFFLLVEESLSTPPAENQTEV
jgi:transcriptional regulator with XRE-family HTH domain